MKRIAIYLIMLAALMACSSDDSNDDPVNTKEYIVVDEIVKLNDQEEYSLTVKANCKWSSSAFSGPNTFWNRWRASATFSASPRAWRMKLS